MILQKLEDENRPVAWLAGEIGTDPSNLRKALKKNSMNTDLLKRITKALKYNFFHYYEAHDD